MPFFYSFQLYCQPSPGKYGLVINFLGHLSSFYLEPITNSGDETVDAGEHGLFLNITALDEVSITGQASTTPRKIKKQVYNTEQFVTPTGGTAIDILPHPTDHLLGFVALVAVLVFNIRVDQGKVAGFQGLLLPFFVHQCARALDHIV